MATRTFRIQNYWVFLGSKLLVTAAVGQPAAVPTQALIHCVGENGESLAIFCLNKDREVANTDSDDWPNRTSIDSTHVRGEIFVPADQYRWYLDILRNEDPVFGHVDDSTPHMNRIWCNEPVGEGEYFGA
ncbi:MAG: hypothetical protein OET44_20310 [Gammaproteobacteria bacterium]|nr:hypothetical protein [Gammaproteobacteria bacterium]